MITKTYEIEVVQTHTVKVVLPETYNTEEMIRSWASDLWELENGITGIAEYAARMAAACPGCDHDGIGKMIENPWTKPDYETKEFQVVAIIQEEGIESEVISESSWEEV